MSRLRDPSYRRAIEALVERRKKIGMRQNELARALGKLPSYVYKSENFERRVDVQEYVAIAKILGLKGKQLLKAIGADS